MRCGMASAPMRASARAAPPGSHPSDYRVVAASGKYDDTLAFRMRPPRRLRARHLELAIGAISTSQETRAFVSFGPVWRLPINSRFLFVELGFSPTVIAGSSFNGRDLGGNFHFTSSASVGATFGARKHIRCLACSTYLERWPQQKKSRFGHDRAQFRNQLI